MNTTAKLLQHFRTDFGAAFHDIRDGLPSGKGVYQTRQLSSIDRVIIHHTAGYAPWGAIARYHVDSKGYPGIAYHIGIIPSGHSAGIWYLGSLDTHRWHAGPKGNDRSVAICVMGNFETEKPDPKVRAQIVAVIDVLQDELGQLLIVQGHRDVAQTACPGRHLYELMFAPYAPAPEPPVDLPEKEPVATIEKLRWWLEEAQRQHEAGNAERAVAIWRSAVILARRIEGV